MYSVFIRYWSIDRLIIISLDLHSWLLPGRWLFTVSDQVLSFSYYHNTFSICHSVSPNGQIQSTRNFCRFRIRLMNDDVHYRTITWPHEVIHLMYQFNSFLHGDNQVLLRYKLQLRFFSLPSPSSSAVWLTIYINATQFTTVNWIPPSLRSHKLRF